MGFFGSSTAPKIPPRLQQETRLAMLQEIGHALHGPVPAVGCAERVVHEEVPTWTCTPPAKQRAALTHSSITKGAAKLDMLSTSSAPFSEKAKSDPTAASGWASVTATGLRGAAGIPPAHCANSLQRPRRLANLPKT